MQGWPRDPPDRETSEALAPSSPGLPAKADEAAGALPAALGYDVERKEWLVARLSGRGEE